MQLLAVPVTDFLHLEAHHDAMVRELTLVSMHPDEGTSASRDLIAPLAEKLVKRLVAARGAASRVVQGAAERGEPRVDICVDVTPAQLATTEGFIGLVEEADRLSEKGILLTTPTPLHLAALRRDLVAEMAEQLRTGRAPAPIRPVVDVVQVSSGLGTEAREYFLDLLQHVGGVAWEADAISLQPTFISGGLAELVGRDFAGIGHSSGPWSDVIDERDRERVEKWRRSIRPDPTASIDYRVITANGATRWLRDRAAFVDHLPGERRVAGLTVDVTDEQAEVRRREARMVVAELLADATSLEEVATRVLGAIANGSEWKLGALWLVDTDADAMRYRAHMEQRSRRVRRVPRADEEPHLPAGRRPAGAGVGGRRAGVDPRHLGRRQPPARQGRGGGRAPIRRRRPDLEPRLGDRRHRVLHDARATPRARHAR